MNVKGLPPGATTVQGVEGLSCHESDLSIAIDTTTAPGSYRSKIKGPTSGLVPSERVLLKILAP